jgi:hypothetical protein
MCASRPSQTLNPPLGGARLSVELQGLVEAFAERKVTMREMLEAMHGRGYNLFLALLAFPFCTPIPLPGVSTLFGLVITLIGLRLALGRKPWLPARLLDKQLPAKFFPRLIRATRRVVGWLELLLKRRLTRVMEWGLARRGMGLMIGVCGSLLLLPLPIPFSNFMPAMTVLLLAIALMEDDGYVALAGGCFFVLTLAFFAALGWGGFEGIDWLKERFAGEQPV